MLQVQETRLESTARWPARVARYPGKAVQRQGNLRPDKEALPPAREIDKTALTPGKVRPGILHQGSIPGTKAPSQPGAVQAGGQAPHKDQAPPEHPQDQGDIDFYLMTQTGSKIQ